MYESRSTVAAFGLGLAVLALVACSDSGPETQPTVTSTITVMPTPDPTISDPSIPSASNSSTSSLTPRPDGPPVLGFGEAFDYSDGVTVNVTNLGTTYVDSGAESTGGQVVELELAITNNSESAIDPTGADGTMTYGAQGVTAEKVFNYENGWSGGYFTGTLLPGRTATVTTAYAVPNVGLGDLVFEFTPDWGEFERGSVIYVSQK